MRMRIELRNREPEGKRNLIDKAKYPATNSYSQTNFVFQALFCLTLSKHSSKLTLLSDNMTKNDSKNIVDLRREIMKVAREMFVEKGYENVSMRKIAGKIGYSATTIYLYFKDKNDLLNQICEATFVRLAENITAIYHLSDNPMEKLRSGMREYVYFGLKNPSEYTLVFITPLPREYDPSEVLSGEAAFETLRIVVAECVKEDQLRINDVELISQIIWSGLHGVTSLLIQHSGFPFVNREKLIDSAIETYINGLKA